MDECGKRDGLLSQQRLIYGQRLRVRTANDSIGEVHLIGITSIEMLIDMSKRCTVVFPRYLQSICDDRGFFTECRLRQIWYRQRAPYRSTGVVELNRRCKDSQ